MTQAASITHLFTDIEGSTRLWEELPARMQPALARHDALCREIVRQRCGASGLRLRKAA